jgi:RNA polymerase sigma-70 factor (ECF subfamily)
MESRLQRALEQLPENQRQILLLRFYGDMKFVEIAEMLGCPLNTALGRVHKAVIKLRQLLKD